MPDNGGDCEHESLRIRSRDLHDRNEDDDNDNDGDEEFTQELDENDHDFFSHTERAVERLLVFSLQISAEIELPCSDGYRCSSEGQCVEASGITNLGPKCLALAVPLV